jgi:pyridoxine kinase
MGDDGELYVAQDVAEAIRDNLMPLATILTPNLFELGWLAGDLHSKDYITLAQRLPCQEILITSVPAGEKIGTYLVQAGGLLRHQAMKLANVPNGTGDHLAGLYLGHRLQNAPDQAFIKAMAGLEGVVKRSAGKAALRVT